MDSDPLKGAVEVGVKAAIEGIGTFLDRVCIPAAEEFGLLLKDRVSYWRLSQLIKIVGKAEQKLREFKGPEDLKAHPRLVFTIIEQGSWAEGEELQEMWSGLLASSCTKDGKDDSNVLFLSLLSQLTASEAMILNYACQEARKYRGTDDFVYASWLEIPISELQKISRLENRERLVREMEHLMSMGLLESWHKPRPYTSLVNVTPTLLALQFFVRCQGSLRSPREYFRLAKSESVG